MKNNYRRSILPAWTIRTASALALILGSSTASAGALRINFDDFFDVPGPIEGQNWKDTFNTDVNVDGQIATSDGGAFFRDDPIVFENLPNYQPVPSLFSSSLNVGLVSYDTFCVSENGSFWMAQSACGANAGTNPLFTVLGGAWLSDGTPNGASGDGAVSIGNGFVDPNLDGGAYELEDGRRVLRIHWNRIGLDGDLSGDQYSFQAVLFNLGGGDFDVEFNYFESYALGGGFGLTQGITGITDAFTNTAGSTVATGSARYEFRGGALSTTKPPITVPEPTTLTLLLGGLVAAVGMRRRRRT